MPKVSLYNMAGKVVGDLNLKDEVFDAPYNQGLIHQIYVGLRANKRRGTHCTKTRGEVRGGGRKPWRQKGTGMARHGSRRSPIWRGGGITFGPRPRSYNQKLPKKMRHGALRSAISHRLREARLTALDELSLDEFRTKAIVELLTNLEVTERKTLLVLSEPNQKVEKSASNIPGLNLVLAANLNVIDLVHHGRVVATKQALEKIEEVLS